MIRFVSVLCLCMWGVAANATSVVELITLKAAQEGWRVYWDFNTDSELTNTKPYETLNVAYPQWVKKVVSSYNYNSTNQAIVMVCKNNTLVITDDIHKYMQCTVVKGN